MVTYESNKLKLENSQGAIGEFTKDQFSIPASCSGFEVIEEYDLSTASESGSKVSIHCSSIEIDLNEFSRQYQNDAECEDHELFDEIEYEFKVLSEMSNIDRVKTDSSSSLVSVQIQPATNGVESHLTLKRQGVFKLVKFHVALPERIFEKLVEAAKHGSLKNLNTTIEISGFNLGYKLGKGSSGLLFENGQNFELYSLSTTLSNPQDSILSALIRLERRIKKIGETTNE